MLLAGSPVFEVEGLLAVLLDDALRGEVFGVVSLLSQIQGVVAAFEREQRLESAQEGFRVVGDVREGLALSAFRSDDFLEGAVLAVRDVRDEVRRGHELGADLLDLRQARVVGVLLEEAVGGRLAEVEEDVFLLGVDLEGDVVLVFGLRERRGRVVGVRLDALPSEVVAELADQLVLRAQVA